MRTHLATASLLIGLLVAACGGTATTSPSADASPSDAASPSVPASTEPSPVVESPPLPTAEPSVEIPSFALPSGAADLEAMLPGELCGEQTLKFSLGGADFADGADDQTIAVLNRLGKQPSDVSMAVAGTAGTTGTSCGVGIIRIAGANTDQLRQVFIDTAREDGDQVSEQSIAGRNVVVLTDAGTGEVTYYDFVGDAVVFVSGPEDQVGELFDTIG